MNQKITTVPEFRAAISEADTIYVHCILGCYENWVVTSKSEAEYIVSKLGTTATPESIGMFTDFFAHSIGNLLFIG